MTAPPRTAFDLLNEPWIPVRRLDGNVTNLGIRGVLRGAHELRSIGGELPTVSFAITRMLLAVLHRAFDPDIDPVVTWKALWEAPELPADLIDEYLADFEERFDLLHPLMPFYQVPDLRKANGEVDGLGKLIADVPNGNQFFTTRAGAALRSIPFGEAARWLVHAMAFDASGTRSGAVGDPRVQKGKVYPIGVAWVGSIGGIVLEGQTVRESLLLNLTLGDVQRGGAAHPDDDLPLWERPPLTAAVELVDGLPHLVPRGPADLFTWPSRRIRLAHDGAAVTGVVLCNGDPLAPQNRFTEPMTTWRRSEPQERKLGGRVYMPRTHDPAKSLWRGLAALVPQGIREQQRADGAASLTAAVLEWLALLQNRHILPLELVLHTRAVGISYGSNNSVIDEIVDDSVAIHAVLFGEGGRMLADRAIGAVTGTEQAVNAVVNLAGNLVVAAGGDAAVKDGARAAAREQCYFSLDAPFRAWLAGLDSHTDPLEALYVWYGVAWRHLQIVADDLLAAAGPAAWVGRDDNFGRHIDTSQADVWFRPALHKALPPPAAFDDPLPDKEAKEQR